MVKRLFLNAFCAAAVALAGCAAPARDSGRVAMFEEDTFRTSAGELRITFIGHETMGSKMAREYLDNLKFPGYEVDFVAQAIAGHLRPAVLGQQNPDRPRIAYRFFRDYPESAVAMALISLADRLAAQGGFVTEDINEQHRSGVAYLLNCLYEETDIVVRPPKLIDGSQLMTKLGIQPGPIIGYLLGKVREAQVQGEVKTADEAIEYCRKLIGANPPDAGGRSSC